MRQQGPHDLVLALEDGPRRGRHRLGVPWTAEWSWSRTRWGRPCWCAAAVTVSCWEDPGLAGGLLLRQSGSDSGAEFGVTAPGDGG